MLDLLVTYGLPFGAGLLVCVGAAWSARQPLRENIKILESSVELWEEMYDDLRDRQYATDRENAHLRTLMRPSSLCYQCKYDGFVGQRIGGYITREGRLGFVLQALETKVVHVYAADNLIEYTPPKGRNCGSA